MVPTGHEAEVARLRAALKSVCSAGSLGQAMMIVRMALAEATQPASPAADTPTTFPQGPLVLPAHRHRLSSVL
jgi:hypothetical protein